MGEEEGGGECVVLVREVDAKLSKGYIVLSHLREGRKDEPLPYMPPV